MIRLLSVVGLMLVVGFNAFAQSPKAKDAVKKVEATFEPASAKPGETVTLKITVVLAEGYHTYPIVQPSPEAKFSANGATFPKDGPIIFVGETVDPINPKVKKLEDYEMLIYPGGGTWIRKAVVSPASKAGAVTAKMKFKLSVCDENNCFPPKTFDLEATLKVAEGSAVEVEPKYKSEVEKALKK